MVATRGSDTEDDDAVQPSEEHDDGDGASDGGENGENDGVAAANGGVSSADLNEGPRGPGNAPKGDAHNKDGEDDDEEDYLPELLEFPHEEWDPCVCYDEEYNDLTFEEFFDVFRDRCDMDEEEMREYHSRLWEHRGSTPNGFVSSYFSCCRLDRHTYQAVVDYDMCTPTELRGFVRARGLQDPYPAGLTMKYFYLRTLAKADKDWTFRLMDLPPELRGMVFRELLLFESFNRFQYEAHPAILQTCRQVRDEATSILYDENWYFVGFGVCQFNGGRLIKYVTVPNDHVHVNYGSEVYYRMPEGIEDYPEVLRRVKRLQVQLKYDVEGTIGIIADGYHPLNHLLYTLCSCLMEGHRIQELHIKLDFPDNVEANSYGTVLFPLRRLSNICTVTFEGFVPPNVQKHLKRDLASNEPKFNTMRHWQILHEQATQQLRLYTDMHYVACDCGECPFTEGHAELECVVSMISAEKKESSFSSVLEESFIARLDSLKKELAKLDAKVLAQTLEKIMQSRKALEDHEEGSDDGRLAEAGKIWARKIHRRHSHQHHDWSDDEDSETEEGEPIQSAADQLALLNKGDIAGVMEEWEPDAASQLSRASSPSAYEPDGSDVVDAETASTSAN